MGHFKFGMDLCKSYKKSGKEYVVAKVSDTRMDYHTEHMSGKALDSMLGFAKNGYLVNGDHRRVWLLESHSSTFKLGEAVDGYIEKSSDDHLELFFVFELDRAHPYSSKLFNDIEDGKCELQLSVGGDALGRTYYDEKIKKNVTELVDVTLLEHVACTRPDRSAVASAGFLQAMIKSVEKETPAYTGSIPFDTIYRNPSQGDVYIMNEAKEAAIDKSIADLTDMVKSIMEKGKTPVTEPVGDVDAELMKNPAFIAYLQKEKDKKDAEAREIATQQAIAKAITDALAPINAKLEKIGQPRPRTTAGVISGAKEVQKDSDGNVTPDGDAETAVEKALVELEKELAGMETKAVLIKDRRAAGHVFTEIEQMEAQNLASKIGKTRTAISYARATGILPV